MAVLAVAWPSIVVRILLVLVYSYAPPVGEF